MEHVKEPKFLGLPSHVVHALVECDDTAVTACALSFYWEYLQWGPCPGSEEAMRRRLGPRSWTGRATYERTLELLLRVEGQLDKVEWLDVDRDAIVKKRLQAKERGQRGADRRWGRARGVGGTYQAARRAAGEGAVPDVDSSSPYQYCHENGQNDLSMAGVHSSAAIDLCLAPSTQGPTRAPVRPSAPLLDPLPSGRALAGGTATPVPRVAAAPSPSPAPPERKADAVFGCECGFVMLWPGQVEDEASDARCRRCSRWARRLHGQEAQRAAAAWLGGGAAEWDAAEAATERGARSAPGEDDDNAESTHGKSVSALPAVRSVPAAAIEPRRGSRGVVSKVRVRSAVGASPRGVAAKKAAQDAPRRVAACQVSPQHGGSRSARAGGSGRRVPPKAAVLPAARRAAGRERR